VLDRDQSALSENYALNIAGSRYFIEGDRLFDYAEFDQRMRSGGLALAIEIPPGFGRDVARSRPVESGRGSTGRCLGEPRPSLDMFAACTKAGWRAWLRSDLGGHRRSALRRSKSRCAPVAHMKKLGISARTDLVRFAIREGFAEA